jgi:hypothetical protein
VVEGSPTFLSFDANGQLAGMVVSAASPGVCIVLGVIVWGTNDVRLYAAKYTAPNTWSADVFATQAAEFPNQYSYGLQHVGDLLRWRCVYNSATSLDLYYSVTKGAKWETMATGYNGSFTPGAIGYMASRNNNGVECMAAYDRLIVRSAV